MADLRRLVAVQKRLAQQIGENQEIPKDAARTHFIRRRRANHPRRDARNDSRHAPDLFSAGDTIQTQNDGRAQIKMIDGSVLSVRPNRRSLSATVLRSSAEDVRVTLDDGQINVKTEDQTENTKNVVEVKQSENRLFPQTDASFGSTDKQGGEIRISRGNVETNVGGEKTIFRATNLPPSITARFPRKKNSDPPKMFAPTSAEKIRRHHAARRKLLFAGKIRRTVSISKYRLQVSTSRIFRRRYDV